MAVILSGDKQTRDMLCGMIALYGGSYGITEKDPLAVMDADTLTDSDIFEVISSGGLEDFPILVICRGLVSDEEKRFTRLIPKGGRIPVFLRRPFTVQHFLTSAAAIAGNRPGIQNDPPPSIEIHLPEAGRDTAANLFFGAENVKLTARETALLLYFLDRKGKDISREALAKDVWGIPENETNVADVYVCYLRRKLKKLCGRDIIFTVRGKGYRFDTSEFKITVRCPQRF